MSYGKSNPEREQIIPIQLLQKKTCKKKSFLLFLRQELAKDRFSVNGYQSIAVFAIIIKPIDIGGILLKNHF